MPAPTAQPESVSLSQQHDIRSPTALSAWHSLEFIFVVCKFGGCLVHCVASDFQSVLQTVVQESGQFVISSECLGAQLGQFEILLQQYVW